MTDAPPGLHECPLCDRPAYPDYWQMLGCAGRDLAAAEDPDSPTGRLLAGRPVQRDDAPARRPTVADLSVFAVAALLKVSATIAGLTDIAGLAQGALADSSTDHAEFRARLEALEAAATPDPEPTPDPPPGDVPPTD